MQLSLLLIFIYPVYCINIQRHYSFVHSAPSGLTPRSNGRLWMSGDSLPEDFFENENQHFFNQDNEFPRDLHKSREFSINQVVLLGRIGHIYDPITFENGGKCIRLSLCTSERYKSGVVFTEWHRIAIYGIKCVDYISSFAGVGDKVLVMGSLRYFQPMSPEPGNTYRKISEIAVNTYDDGHRIILLSKKQREASPQYGDSFSNENNFGLDEQGENYIE